MAHDGIAPSHAGGENSYKHLVDPTKKWYKNSRLIRLNLWIVLLFVVYSTFLQFVALMKVIFQPNNVNSKWLRWQYDE